MYEDPAWERPLYTEPCGKTWTPLPSEPQCTADPLRSGTHECARRDPHESDNCICWCKAKKKSVKVEE